MPIITNKQMQVRRLAQAHFLNKQVVPKYLMNTLVILAPANFSLFTNYDEVVGFFNECISCIEKCGKAEDIYQININLQDTKIISIETIMYLIGMASNKYSKSVRFVLNPPNDEKLKKFILSTGIEKYIYKGDELDVLINNDYFSIKSGSKSDGEIAKAMCDFVNKILNTDMKYSKFLYDMLIEMMTNTEHHAFIHEAPIGSAKGSVSIKKASEYIDKKSEPVQKEIFQNQWFIFVEDDIDCIKFTFLDMGKGIPATMKAFLISVRSIMTTDINIMDMNNDSQLIAKTLREGNFVTRTEKANRGKGLPEVFAHYSEHKKTSNFRVMSGKGLCTFNDDDRNNAILHDLKQKFRGTLFYWEIKKNEAHTIRYKSNLKGGHYDKKSE